MAATDTEIEVAYRKLKSYVYYDKTDLRLRERLAKFECSDKFEANLQAVQEVAGAANPASDRRFKRWLRQIGCRVVPKKLGPPRSATVAANEAGGKFITNVTSAPLIKVETVNYFFDGPIELHLIAVLWLMRDGKHLDARFLPECCGSRLSPKLHEENDDSLQLFTKYHEQYSRWRDTGIRKAKQLLVEERRSVAILGLDLKDVEASYLGSPNLGRARLKPFTTLLNEVSQYRSSYKRRVDLIVFPEVSVPHAWEGMLAAWVRRHRIGVVCGLEHRIDHKGQALNEVLALLPYQTGNGHWACLPVRRLKRFYSPAEEFILKNEHLAVPKTKGSRYHLFRWRGASFAIYNCFELASIEDRAIFKGHVDFIVATEFNRDTSYFSNIVEAAARDLHCYIVQVNDSGFGDSRVVSPSKSDFMNPVRIKGGDNLTFVTMSLNLSALRTHQRKGYGLQKEAKEFKPTPPDFPMAALKKRIALGK